MHDEDCGSIEQAMIGWGEQDDYFEIGEGDNESLPLFFVTLTRGRNHALELEERPQGQELVCRWGLPVKWIPPKGALCLVAIPAGMAGIAGAGVIIAVMDASPAQFKADRAVLTAGADVHFLVLGRSVTLADSGAITRYVSVGTPYGGGVPGVYGKGMCFFGNNPLPANTALLGATGISGVPSPSVFLSLT